ncbi:MAG: SPOR domain-containing protein [Kangiellaceae bacterium]|jgi:septal ring-binding cell division protein DamX|nr:SPOR domain-containing protein [Kangiellaceae bacterium]
MTKSNSDEHNEYVSLKTQAEVIEKLEYYSIYADKLIILSVEDGVGTTTLLNQLATKLTLQVNTIYADCANQDWFSDVLEECNISSPAGQQSFQLGLNMLAPNDEILLVLDNAEQLTFEQLESLKRKVKESKLHCIAAIGGNPVYNEWINENSNDLIQVDLANLDIEDSIKLLAFLLGVDEQQVPLLIDEGDLIAFLQKSEGNPAKLKALADEILAEQRGNRAINWPLKNVLSSIVYFLIAIALIVALIFQDEINQQFVSGNDYNTDSLPDNNAVDESAKKINDAIEGNTAAADQAQKLPKLEERLDQTNKERADDSVNEKVESADSATSSTAGYTNQSATIAADRSGQKLNGGALNDSSNTFKSNIKKADNNSAKLVAETQQQQSVASDQPDQLNEQSIVGNKPLAEDSVNNSTVDNTVATEGATNELTGDSSNKPAESSQQRQSAMPIKEAGIPYGEHRYLNSLVSTDWMIQLAGFSDLDNAAKFMQQHISAGELHFYRTKRNSKNWYVVVLGPFPNKLVASRQRDRLSPVLKAVKPWLKSVNQIKQDIEVNEG